MGALDGFGQAMRALRERRADRSGVRSQTEWAKRAGVSIGTVNKLELEQRLPDFETVDRLLSALGARLSDLAEVLDERDGGPVGSVQGKARATWVEGLRRQGIDEPAIESYAWANSDRNDPAGEADLVASAQEAARLIAESALEKRRRTLAEIASERGTR